MAFVRYGLGGVMILGGVALIVINPSGVVTYEQEQRERRERGS